MYIRGHPLLRRVCTSVTNGVALQAIPNLRKLNNKKLRVEFYSTISRHAKTDESIVLVIWLNERVLGSERMLKRWRLGLKGNTVGIRSSTRYCVVIVRRNSHCGDEATVRPPQSPCVGGREVRVIRLGVRVERLETNHQHLTPIT